jgi:hypothetical protein
MATNGKVHKTTGVGKAKERGAKAGKTRTWGGPGSNDPRRREPQPKRRFFRALTNERRFLRAIYRPYPRFFQGISDPERPRVTGKPSGLNFFRKVSRQFSDQ